jgi:hypothetical protein
LILLALGLGAFFCCQWVPSGGSTVENYWLKGDTLLIRLSDGTGWELEIYREGRGDIRYGRHPNNVLTFDDLGLHFDSLRRHLAGSHKKVKSKAFRPARVAYLVSDQLDEHTEILDNAELGMELFRIAFEAGLQGTGDLRAKRRMHKLFLTRPPFGQQ